MMLPKVPLRLAFLIDVDFRFNKVDWNATWQLCPLTLTDTNGTYKKKKSFKSDYFGTFSARSEDSIMKYVFIVKSSKSETHSNTPTD